MKYYTEKCCVNYVNNIYLKTLKSLTDKGGWPSLQHKGWTEKVKNSTNIWQGYE